MFPPPIPPHQSSSPGEAPGPDPLFMALRSAVANGPLGWFARRLDAWREAREIRREFTAAITAADDHVRSLVPPTSTAEHREPPADLAA